MGVAQLLLRKQEWLHGRFPCKMGRLRQLVWTLCETA